MKIVCRSIIVQHVTMACPSERKIERHNSIVDYEERDQDENLSIVRHERQAMTGKTNHFYLVSGARIAQLSY